MTRLLNKLRAAFFRFVDDGGLYSSYNGEPVFEDAAKPVRRVPVRDARVSGRLALDKA